MSRIFSCLAVSSLALLANAATQTFDWNVTWVNRDPDGLAQRPVIGINGQWPIPVLNITKGDRVVVNMHNEVCSPRTIALLNNFR